MSMIDAVAAGLSLALPGGRLSDPARLARDKLAHIRESDTRIAALTGQRFMPREDLHCLPGASVQALAVRSRTLSLRKELIA